MSQNLPHLDVDHAALCLQLSTGVLLNKFASPASCGVPIHQVQPLLVGLLAIPAQADYAM